MRMGSHSRHRARERADAPPAYALSDVAHRGQNFGGPPMCCATQFPCARPGVEHTALHDPLGLSVGRREARVG